MNDFLKTLKEQVSIVDVVGEYVRLKKSGSNHSGLCPFHSERTPSFSVSEKKGIFHCFGCQKGGDAISFIQEVQGISFPEAVRALAARAGLRVPPELLARGTGASAPAQRESTDLLHKLNRFVAQYYHEKLISPQGARAREYLRERGISEATIKRHYLGYASIEWNELYDFLVSKKAPIEVAESLGLIRLRQDADTVRDGRRHYDLFRNRILFPVVDSRGRVIAFGGRAMPSEAGSEDSGPKYLNSSESPIFKKSQSVYGLFSAQKDIRAEDLIVIVEGFMDCLALQQAGIGYCVATLGTAMTEKHVAMLARYSRNFVLLFDGDRAGREAQVRAMETCLSQNVVARGVSLPEGVDPDDFVNSRGRAELEGLIREAPYLLDREIWSAFESAGATEQKARALDRVLPWIAKLPPGASKIARLELVSTQSGVSVSLLERQSRELSRPMVPKSPAEVRPAIERKPKQFKVDALEARVLSLLLERPELSTLLGSRSEVLGWLSDAEIRRLVEWIYLKIEAGTDFSREIVDFAGESWLKTMVTRLLIDAERNPVGTSEASPEDAIEKERVLAKEVEDLRRRLERRALERKREQLRARLSRAESTGEKASDLSAMLSEYQSLCRQLNELLSAAGTDVSASDMKEEPYL